MKYCVVLLWGVLILFGVGLSFVIMFFVCIVCIVVFFMGSFLIDEVGVGFMDLLLCEVLCLSVVVWVVVVFDFVWGSVDRVLFLFNLFLLVVVCFCFCCDLNGDVDCFCCFFLFIDVVSELGVDSVFFNDWVEVDLIDRCEGFFFCILVVEVLFNGVFFCLLMFFGLLLEEVWFIGKLCLFFLFLILFVVLLMGVFGVNDIICINVILNVFFLFVVNGKFFFFCSVIW